jgi:hypothetical protein
MVTLPLAAPPARHEFNFSDSPEMGVTPADLVAAINQFLIPGKANASVDPTSSNDSTQGYQVGSMWFNSITGRLWMARNVSVAAAVWTLMGPASDHPGYIAGNWYVPAGYTLTSSGATPAINSIRAYPGLIRGRITISNLGSRVITNVAASNAQLAIYANNPATGRPTGVALASTASLSCAAASTISGAVSVQLEPGLYWFCGNVDTATLTFTVQDTSTSGIMGSTIGSATQGNAFGTGSGSLDGLSVNQTFGTWPDLTSASFNELSGQASVIGVEFQVASVP